MISTNRIIARNGILDLVTVSAKCPHVEHNSCKSLQTDDLDQKQKCNGCGNTTKVNLWKCKCNTHWHNCRIHRWESCKARIATAGMKANKMSQSSDKPDVRSKCKRPRANCNFDYEQLLEEDLQRAKRTRMDDDEWAVEPAIILGYPRTKSIRVASLGPALKRRFIHPGGI